MTKIATALTCLLLLAACCKAPAWKAPSVGLIATNDGSMFYIEKMDGPVLIVYCAGDLDADTSDNSNSTDRTFNYSGTLTSETGVQLSYKYLSSSIHTIELGDSQYDLSSGTVFCIQSDGQIAQLPFKGLTPSKECLERLKDHFNANKRHQPTADRRG